MKKIILSVATLFTLAAAFQSCKKPAASPITINVSGLLSLTGNGSTLGLNSKAAMQLAADDINAYFQNKGEPLRFSVTFYDTHLNPDTAQADCAKIYSANSHFVIGPQSSAELAKVAMSNNSAILVSQGSTAGSLAIAGDGIFRFCPPDKVEGAAIANSIYNSGIRGLAMVARNDAGNQGLQSATAASFVAKGGAVSTYNTYTTSTTDFTTVLANLHATISQLATTYGINNTGVYLASFEEGATLFAQAVTDSLLSQVKWYGGDGIVLSSAVTADTNASNFALRTSFFAPSFGLPLSLQNRWKPVSTRVQAITGIAPDGFALSAYDAMWVMAYTEESSNGSSTYNDLRNSFAQLANTYIGITGSTALDSNGDRASGSFDYWGISKSAGTCQWVVVGESD